MSDETDPVAQPEAITHDRRRAVARFVEFRDVDAQKRFITSAEHAYWSLVASDTWGAIAHIEARTERPPARNLPFRRRRRPTTLHIVPSTAALARVHQIAADTPRELAASPSGCSASHDVALVLVSVTTELLRELLALTPTLQVAHPAYRQTLRLAAELEGMRSIVPTQTCTGPDACVGVRKPGHLDRRVEDVEVAEVRAVLLQLGRAAQSR
jgi:hypothetical protein